MEVYNNSNFKHLLFRAALLDDNFAASIALRVNYSIEEGMATAITMDPFWKLEANPQETIYGSLINEAVIKRGGIDLFLFGYAYGGKEKNVKFTDVEVNIPGKFSNSIKVFGDRHWDLGLLKYNITDPKAFDKILLSNCNSYGGFDLWDGVMVPDPFNPDGKGYAVNKDSLHGKPLPNIEDPNNLINSWKDKPSPVGVCATRWCEKRIKIGLGLNGKPENSPTKLSPILYNDAYLGMITNGLLPGDNIVITGMNAKGKFQFKIPNMDMKLKLRFADNEYNRKFYIDQIGIEPDENRAFITYRYAFNYKFKAKEKREIFIN